MKRLILILLLLLPLFAAIAQQRNQHIVEPVGKYKEINLEKDAKMMQALMDTTRVNGGLLDSIKRTPNIYTPPVLYMLSVRLFNSQKYDEAAYWFYVAQLRARYDINRCADKTATAQDYNVVGLYINEYALKDLENLEQIVKKVVEFVRTNEEQYDQRWINLTGMDAMTAGLGGKEEKELSVDKSKWPEIKAKTIEDYYNGFMEMKNSKK